jgi:hypothetical protein
MIIVKVIVLVFLLIVLGGGVVGAIQGIGVAIKFLEDAEIDGETRRFQEKALRKGTFILIALVIAIIVVIASFIWML